MAVGKGADQGLAARTNDNVCVQDNNREEDVGAGAVVAPASAEAEAQPRPRLRPTKRTKSRAKKGSTTKKERWQKGCRRPTFS